MRDKKFSPVFLIGCGRSGTSFLGNTLSKHPEIVYLNEPRKLWSAGYPETDIWSKQASENKGVLFMGPNFEVPEKSQVIRGLFLSELKKKNKKVLIEKLPINTFRLGLINKIFPSSRFIHIFRDGIDVARSIEERCINGRWFGDKEYKLAQLISFAESDEKTEEIPALCDNYFEKGLMEWRLSVESIVRFLSSIEDSRYIELSYESLINHPRKILEDLFAFLNLKPEVHVINYAMNSVKRKERTDSKVYYTEKNKKIGGKLLECYMNNDTHFGLVRHNKSIFDAKN